MIVCFDSEGQLCNRLWGLLPVISHARSKHESVFVLFFNRYAKLFPGLKGLNNVHFPRLSPFDALHEKLAILVRRCLNNSRLRYRRPLDQRKRSVSLVNAWEHRSDGIDLNLMPLFREVFRPDQPVVEAVESFLSELRNDGSVIVGVHIRRGDYRQFEQGRFFYGDDEYFGFIKQVVTQFEARGRFVKCLICSDEIVNHGSFAGLTTYSLPTPSAMADWYALSRCDCILGAPSTFSQWASFYGQVPLWLVWDKQQPIELESFGVCVGLDKTNPVTPDQWLTGKKQA